VRSLGLAVLALAIAIVAAISWSAIRLAEASTRPLAFQAPSGAQRILILGYGGGDHLGAYLSDSLVLVMRDGSKQAEVSIPRDLWVQLPPNSGRYARINEALQDGYNAGSPDTGAELAARKVAEVTGQTVTGWVLQDFQGFRQLIDALGGVDVDVARSFSAQYPVNDNPDVDARWKVIHFNAGRQHMDGEQALEFARARYADVPQEASDFARAARQQLLIGAVRQRLASPAGGLHFVAVANAAPGAVRTNLSPVELLAFLSGFRPEQAKHISLDSVVVDGRSPDGAQILLPRNGNYQLISEYVRSQLA